MNYSTTLESSLPTIYQVANETAENVTAVAGGGDLELFLKVTMVAIPIGIAAGLGALWLLEYICDTRIERRDQDSD